MAMFVMRLTGRSATAANGMLAAELSPFSQSRLPYAHQSLCRTQRRLFRGLPSGRRREAGMNRRERRAAGSAAAGLSPAFVDAFNTGLKHQNEGQLEKAVVSYRKALTFNPNHALLHNNLGVVFYTMGQLDEAVVHYQKAIAIDPNMPLALNNLAVTLNTVDRHDEAIPIFYRSLKFQPGNPKALNNLGDSYNKIGRFAEARPLIEQAIAAVPDYAEAISNLGMTLWGLRDLDAAVATFKRALALQPDLAMAHKNLGLVYLLTGNYAEAWREYAWRQIADRIPPRRDVRPMWQGQDLGAGTLLVFPEQGVGDEILYAGMMEDLSSRGVRVLWEADSRLLPLFRRSYPGISFVSRQWPPGSETTPPEVVAQCPVGTLGLFLRADASMFPAQRTRFLATDPARTAALRAATGVGPGEKLIGLSWFSKNPRFGDNKSTALKDWAEAFRIPGVKFVNLQYGDTTDDRAAFRRETGLDLIHLDQLDLTADLDGVAALAAGCDAVVTVSNTVAHIAGAVGVPVTILVPEGMGKLWYWGNNTTTTPWYPTARLLRQTVQDDWRPVMQQVFDYIRDLSNRR
jgi:tetratricopeptide (TPR) repeat protein